MFFQDQPTYGMACQGRVVCVFELTMAGGGLDFNSKRSKLAE